MAFLHNTRSHTVHSDPPECSTDPDSDWIEEIDRLDALDAQGVQYKKCGQCFGDEA